MSQPLSIEIEDLVCLITTRTAESRLWLINDRELEEKILGCLARYQEIYGVIIFAFILMGNHYHLLARFPKRNRAPFMRDFNSAVARIVGRHCHKHGRRAVWARRYSWQALVDPRDILHWFLYVALNAVFSGLVPEFGMYQGFNSFNDASEQRKRTYKWLNWSEFLMKSRYNRNLTPDDCSIEYELKFSKLPGHEHMSDEDYSQFLNTALKARQSQAVEERLAAGKGFMGAASLKKQVRGSCPKSTKTSTRHSFRPLVLSLFHEVKQEFLRMYFVIYDAFKEASLAFRSGDLSVKFPPGTYPPPRLVVST